MRKPPPSSPTSPNKASLISRRTAFLIRAAMTAFAGSFFFPITISMASLQCSAPRKILPRPRRPQSPPPTSSLFRSGLCLRTQKWGLKTMPMPGSCLVKHLPETLSRQKAVKEQFHGAIYIYIFGGILPTVNLEPVGQTNLIKNVLRSFCIPLLQCGIWSIAELFSMVRRCTQKYK